MKRLAFTLIEVMVAVLLISLMSLGLLQMQSDTTHNLNILQKQSHMDQIASSMLIRPDTMYHNKKQDLYTFLKDRYTIDYDPLIHELSQQKFTFRQEQISTIHLDLAKQKALQQGTLDEGVPKLQLLIFNNELIRNKLSAKTISFRMVP